MNELLSLKTVAKRLGLADKACEACGATGNDGVQAVRKNIHDGAFPIVRQPHKRGMFVKSSTLDKYIEEMEETWG